MVVVSYSRVIDERIFFLKEQIYLTNKLEVNKTFQIQIDAIRYAANDLEKIEAIIM